MTVMPDRRIHAVEMTFGEHLDELRARLWLCVIGIAVALVVCLIFGKDLVNFLKQPIMDALELAGEETTLVAINVTDPFMAYVKVSLIAALFLSSPWVVWQLWQFVASGLYPHERRYVHVFAPVTMLLFLAGCTFSYYILVRFGIRFLIVFGQSMDVKPMLRVDTQLMFVLTLSLVMGVVFQLPLVMLVLGKIGIVDSKTFVKKRKTFVIVALIVAAIITPTQDAINLLLATVPILLLYEIGIWLCRVSERKRARDLAG